uniref:Uncharacterized protein n=1 Tax=Anopheles stephensi TaxID=30069 RepID=A0A182Y7G1_ANOST
MIFHFHGETNDTTKTPTLWLRHFLCTADDGTNSYSNTQQRMKLPKWIRRTPKSNVGVKSIVKSSGHSSDGGGGSQRHRRKSCSASLKGKRKRNSYVSSAITTKNFYPAEHFFKTAPSPAHFDGRGGDDVEKMARYRTLPASFGRVVYQPGLQPGPGMIPGHYPAVQRPSQHPLGLPNCYGGIRNKPPVPNGMQLVQQYAPNGMQYTQHQYQPNGMQLVQHHHLQKRLQQVGTLFADL